MFNFPKIQRDSSLEYNNNFLRTVIFQVRFEKNDLIEKKKDEIKELFIDKFPRYSKAISKGFRITTADNTPILEPIQDNTGLEMKSQNGNKIISVNSEAFSLTVAGDEYRNFEHLQKDITNFEEFLRLCEISEVNRVAVRKINLIEFKLADLSEMDLATQILNPELVCNFNYFPDKENIIQNIHNLTYQNDDNRLILKYGIMPTHPIEGGNERETSSVLIDIDAINFLSTKSDEIWDKSSEINNEIFNIFHWALSDDSKKALNYKNNE